MARDGNRKRSVMPAPPFFHSPGDIASWVTNRSCSRPGPDSPESSAASSTLAESRSRPLAWSSVSACMKAFGRQPGPAAEQMVQLVRRDAGGIRHRLDGRLRAPVLRNEGDGAPHRIIVAERGVLGSRFGEAVLIHGKVHHGLGCRPGGVRKPPDFRFRFTTPDYRSARAWRLAGLPARPWQNWPFRPGPKSSRSTRGGRGRPDTAARCRIPHPPSGRAAPTAD